MGRRMKYEGGRQMDYLRNFEEFLQFGIFWGKIPRSYESGLVSEVGVKLGCMTVGTTC
jgi:hypothetical protein